jgi:immunity protein, SdpI family
MRRWYPLVLLLISISASIFAWPRLPERVATHWDMNGDVNGYSSKIVATVIFPILLLVVWGFMRGLPRVDPWRPNYSKMQGAYDLVVNAGLTVVCLVQLAVIAVNLGAPISIARLAPVVVGVVFVMIGNVLPRARQNFWFGIRTPWTLTNARVWERTHRVGGYLMVAAGVLVIVAAFLPIEMSGVVIAVPLLAAGLISVIYSYIAWRQETSR